MQCFKTTARNVAEALFRLTEASFIFNSSNSRLTNAKQQEIAILRSGGRIPNIATVGTLRSVTCCIWTPWLIY